MTTADIFCSVSGTSRRQSKLRVDIKRLKAALFFIYLKLTIGKTSSIVQYWPATGPPVDESYLKRKLTNPKFDEFCFLKDIIDNTKHPDATVLHVLVETRTRRGAEQRWAQHWYGLRNPVSQPWRAEAGTNLATKMKLSNVSTASADASDQGFAQDAIEHVVKILLDWYRPYTQARLSNIFKV
ncbi:uncharacterized protein BCR38DRAFT_128486 [Pseudomassariella vexata]|uniref:Uncharacterized protein n=1 Tax=Pseudomassariella vexata TaxID=1141098 RepID=A0A1Y2E9K0_9PEZI|nr:uncharacterized protein BCR38DRAFT_128486 [Pseudomassariella vexata]ORY68219.1 hypothetical protein BCR38DRAFT_128486 [Pseudomassariella vexata]